MKIDWESRAARLARGITRPGSRWQGPVATIPRHVLVPCWFQPAGSSDGAWERCDGRVDENRWLNAAYSDRSLVTRVGELHADHATEQPVHGRQTSSATLPLLVVIMLQYACIQDDSVVLDVGTGSGYSAAVLARRLGDTQVTSIDLDPYLTKVARERLLAIGLRPCLLTGDATGALQERAYDRIVAMTSVRPIPSTWLRALKPGGRLVTAIANTGIIITADTTEAGAAVGQVEWIAGGFMRARHGSDYPPALQAVAATATATVSRGRYPIPQIPYTWDLGTMMQLAAPGVEHHYRCSDTGQRTASMVHPDGSWAVATAEGLESPTVRQGGPRRLWDILDEIRDRWLAAGCEFPIRGARVAIDPDGTCTLTRGTWKATVA